MNLRRLNHLVLSFLISFAIGATRGIEGFSNQQSSRTRRIRNRLRPFFTNNSKNQSKKNNQNDNNDDNNNIMTSGIEKRELFGKTVLVEIPSEDFPTQEQIDSIDASTGKDCRHGWFPSKSDCHEVIDENDDKAATVVTSKANLHYRYWLPEGCSEGDGDGDGDGGSRDGLKGIVIFTHGIVSHSGHASNIDGRPLDMALTVDTFTAKGFAVYAWDLYGHGFSEGTRFFIPRWQESRDDLVEFVKLVAGENPKSIPLFLSGESYGGSLTVLASRYFQDHPNEAPPNLDASLLVCPAIVCDLPSFPVYQLLRYVLAPLAPRWTPFFMPNTVSADRIWRCEKVVGHYSDPERCKMGLDSIGNPLRLGTAVNLLKAMEEVRERAIPGYDRPFCIVHGDQDVAVPMSGSELLFENCSTPDENKKFSVIESAHHGLLADPKAEESVKVLVDFVDARMNKK